MTTLLLIASIIAYHYPSGLYRDTQRRYNNMRNTGNNIDYDIINHIFPFDETPIYKFPFAKASLLIGAIFPIFCLVQLNIHWLLAVIINIFLYLFVGPTLAFIFTPNMRIYSKNSLKSMAITSIVIGLAFYLIAIMIK